MWLVGRLQVSLSNLKNQKQNQILEFDQKRIILVPDFPYQLDTMIVSEFVVARLFFKKNRLIESGKTQ